MRYASELSLFHTVFVQVAALLLFAAGGMFRGSEETERTPHPPCEMAPAAELLDNRLPAVLKAGRTSSQRLPRNRFRRPAVLSRPLP
ncbi:MAG: hypothetical protein ACLS58_07735 [Sutterella wadsworthensis]